MQTRFLFLFFLLHPLVAPLLQALVFLFGDAHEAAVLWTCHTDDVLWRMEVAHEAVGLANAVVAGLGGVFDVGDVPGVFASELEG